MRFKSRPARVIANIIKLVNQVGDCYINVYIYTIKHHAVFRFNAKNVPVCYYYQEIMN